MNEFQSITHFDVDADDQCHLPETQPTTFDQIHDNAGSNMNSNFENIFESNERCCIPNYLQT